MLISYDSKVMLEILQASLQQYTNFQKYKLGFKEVEESEFKLSIFGGSWRKQRSTRETSASLTMLNPRTMDPNELWKILRDGNIRPPYRSSEKPGQEATVRTRHETTDWF